MGTLETDNSTISNHHRTKMTTRAAVQKKAKLTRFLVLKPAKAKLIECAIGSWIEQFKHTTMHQEGFPESYPRPMNSKKLLTTRKQHEEEMRRRGWRKRLSWEAGPFEWRQTFTKPCKKRGPTNRRTSRETPRRASTIKRRGGFALATGLGS